MDGPEQWRAKLGARLAALGTREGADAECVHELRVAAGRLSVWLELGGGRALRDDLAWLRRSAARVRDLDVLLARHGDEEWTAPLAAARQQASHELARELDSPRARGLLQALEVVAPPQERSCTAALARLERRAARAARRALAGAREDAELHRWRRRVRRLRYALEWLGRDAREAHALQDELGALHDAAVALDAARAAGADTACAERERELAAGRARLDAAWNAAASLHAEDA